MKTDMDETEREMVAALRIIREAMIKYIDGIECWHSRHEEALVRAYVDFVKHYSLIATGGSDCHQQPPVMGTVSVPDWVPGQFGQ